MAGSTVKSIARWPFISTRRSNTTSKRGLTPAEASRVAMRDFGGVVTTREAIHDVRGMTFWESFAQDVRFGLRTLRRSTGYTSAAVLILGLGIGANTAMFSVIDGVLIKPLPFRDGRQLVLVQETSNSPQNPRPAVSVNELYDYRDRLHTITDLVEYHAMNFVLLNQGDPDRVDTGVVSHNFFDVLGMHPIYGRTFRAEDDAPGADAVLVLSHPYWMQKYGGDKNVVGRVVEMNNRPHTIVGILPDFPQYPQDQDVYMPVSACPFRSDESDIHKTHRLFAGLQVFGRLAPGATLEQASAELSTVAPSFAVSFAGELHHAQGLQRACGVAQRGARARCASDAARAFRDHPVGAADHVRECGEPFNRAHDAPRPRTGRAVGAWGWPDAVVAPAHHGERARGAGRRAAGPGLCERHSRFAR